MPLGRATDTPGEYVTTAVVSCVGHKIGPMPRLQSKSFRAPDEVRSPPKGHAEVVTLDDTTVGRARWEPGWRWSTHLKPLAGTASCQFRHLGYSVSGRLKVVTDAGEILEIEPESVYEIPPGHDAWVVGDEAWVTVEWTSARDVGIASDGPGDMVVATLVFTDIVDSTAILKRLGDVAWRERLLLHNVRLRDELNTYRGREIKTTGDGLLAVFDGASRAVRGAAAMSRAATNVGLPIRVGVHTGEVELLEGDARGLAVHAAARVMALGGPGDVLVSSTTAALLEGSGLTLADAGTHQLKGISGARKVYRLVSASQ
jgi:class 3 adenylate cyclase